MEHPEQKKQGAARSQYTPQHARPTAREKTRMNRTAYRQVQRPQNPPAPRAAQSAGRRSGPQSAFRPAQGSTGGAGSVRPEQERAKRPQRAAQQAAQRRPRPEEKCPERRKRRRRAPGGGLFFTCAAVAILGISAAITALIEAPAKREAASSLAAESALQAQLEAQQQAEAAGGFVYGPALPVPDAEYTKPDAALLSLPENGRVDMSYFDDALFIGDSLTRGFQEYQSGIPNAKYAAYLGAGPKQFMEGLVENISGERVSAMDEILAAAPKKVYLLLGTNSMATLTDEAFLKYYEDLLILLKEKLPEDTVWYLQAIPPVSAEKTASDEKFSTVRIQGLNESLAALAYRYDLYYLDLFHVLADEKGMLRPEIASGSIHLNDQGYHAWREYLITHTAHRADNPYLPGSPRYEPPAE